MTRDEIFADQDQSIELTSEEKLSADFFKRIQELKEEKPGMASQKKIREILKICEDSADKIQAPIPLSYLWGLCTQDAAVLLKSQNPKNYDTVTLELQTLAVNFNSLIPLIKKHLPLDKQAALFLTATNVYCSHGFWLKTSKIMAGEGFPLDASTFLVNYYQTQLLQLSDDSASDAKNQVLKKMTEDQSVFLLHSLECMSESKEINPALKQSLSINQEVINGLVEDKLLLHKKMSNLMHEELKSPTEELKISRHTESSQIESKIHGISVTIMTHIFQMCEAMLASQGLTAPRFSVVGTGSFSRKELAPTSDFDCAIIVDKMPTKEQEEYFEKLLDLAIEMIELLQHNTLRIDFAERNFLKPGILINTSQGLIDRTLGVQILERPDQVGVDSTTFGLHTPLEIHRSLPEKTSSNKKLFETYISLWHKNIGCHAEKFGSIIIKKLLVGGDKDSLKEDLLRPVIFWALGLSMIYNENYQNEKSLLAAYRSGKFPASTRENLVYLQENTKSVPKEVSLMAKNLLEILDYAMSMRNYCQMTGAPEVLDSSDPTIIGFKKIIAQSKVIAKQVCDSTTSQSKNQSVTFFRNPMELFKKGVELKEEKTIQLYVDLVGDSAFDYRFSKASKQTSSVPKEDKESPKKETPKQDKVSFVTNLNQKQTKVDSEQPRVEPTV